MSLATILTVTLTALAIAGMVVSLVLIPLGIPGAWMMLGILTVAALLDRIGWPALLGLVALAAASELVEFWIVRAMNVRFGGSHHAFWGAVIGGFAGLFVGLPVFLVGPLITGLLGTFIGAVAGAYYETRQLGDSARIGGGTVLGRALAAVVKTGAGLVILVVGVVALL